MIEAEKLRNKAVLNNVSVRPGYYKWWAKKAELDVILSALNAETPEITAALEEKEGLYCIYVGIAVKESLRKRLDWHVNDKHTASKVKNGTLSTLRQSIASIVAHNQYDKKATDAFIDKLYVEWFESKNAVKSEAAKEEIENIEKGLINGRYLRPLNIRDNKHQTAASTVKQLKKLRKESK